jgi:hypothetical protein
LASNTAGASGTFAAGTDYNAFSNSSAGYTVTGNSHDRLSQTFSFIDEAGDDFHLASNDSGARNYGVNDPGSGLFSSDIDAQTRLGTWDIGADECFFLIVTTQVATNITNTGATGNGNITDTGGENNDKRGFVYDTATHGAPGNVAPGSSGYASYVEDSGSYSTGVFTKDLASLTPNATYYIRAYSHNSLGYSYGGEVSFITSEARIGSSQTGNLTSGLVGMWSFDGADMDWSASSAEALDATANNNDGDVSGAVAAIGNRGQALNFNGTSSNINVGSDSSLDDISIITISAWIYPRGQGENYYGRIFGKEDTNDGPLDFCMGVNPTHRTDYSNVLLLQQNFSGGNGIWHTNNNTLVLNAWNHVVVTYDRSSVNNDPVFYINGTSQTVNEWFTPSGSASSNASYDGIIGNSPD